MKHTFILLVAFLLLATGTLAQTPCSWSPVGGGAALLFDLRPYDFGTGPVLLSAGLWSLASWDGTNWTFLENGSGLAFHALAEFDFGAGRSLYVAGSFGSLGGVVVNSIAMWNGSSWSPLGSGLVGGSPNYNPITSSLAVFDDGTGPGLHAAGEFTTAGGSAANRIAKWDGISWSSLGGGITGVQSSAFTTMTVFDDGSGQSLYVGGLFTTAGGLTVNNIAEWDGTTWFDVGGGVSGVFVPLVRSLTVFDDGSGPALYVGGRFSTAGSVPASNIARWDGVAWTPVGAGIGGDYVAAFGAFDDGNGPALFVGGKFTTAGGVSANNIAKWDGSTWSPLGSGIAQTGGSVVHAVTPFDDGSGTALYSGGSISVAGGIIAQGIARWSCNSGISTSLTQPGGSGSPVFLANSNLIPGDEYYNIFSFDVCPGGPGAGLFGGLCVSSPVNFQFILDQLFAPLGTIPVHFTAPSSYVLSGPFNLPSLTVEALCFDWTGGVLGPISQVATIVIQ